MWLTLNKTMTNGAPTINHIPCHIRQIEFVLAAVACDRCGLPAPRVDTATRTAVDVDLDHPVLLLVRVSVHRCAAFRHYRRAQPPFLRPDAIYTQRVVRKAVEAIYADGMAFRRVGARLARDFWVRPSEAMIRRWCGAYGAARPLDAAYHAWVVAEFSGILCVDDVYQRDLALLLAVDPAAPDGDRMAGYQLVHGRVDAAAVADFLGRLAAARIAPDEVITDGSALYPGVLAEVWPRAAHQRCLFHETRRITRAVLSAIERVRRTLPSPPSWARQGRGRLLRPPHAQSPVPPGAVVVRWRDLGAPREGPRRGRSRPIQASGQSSRAAPECPPSDAPRGPTRRDRPPTRPPGAGAHPPRVGVGVREVLPLSVRKGSTHPLRGPFVGGGTPFRLV